MFFAVLKENDYRYLLKTNVYPDFTPDDLVEIWEDIKKQYEAISKDNSFTSHLEDLNEVMSEINELNRLKAIYFMMRFGDQDSIEELEEMDIIIDDINPESIRRVWSQIQSMQTNIEISFLRDQAVKKLEKGEEFNFYKTLQSLSNLFQRNIPVDITLIEWVFLVKEAKEYNKNRRNGKDRTV